MAKQRTIQFGGEITESLSNALFKVKLINGKIVLGYASGRMRLNHIRILPGDKVTVEMSAYDPERARIIFRAK
ncbi:translation initiation factor IF-1 [Candidatus Tremblaya phenacola PAVE]|nr:translation initiation factor IF-1 [Candidatus Tremblaya phenacola PAVE]